MSFDLRKSLNKFGNQIPYIPKTLNLIWKASGKIIFIWLFLIIIQGLLPAAFVYIIKPFIDNLSNNVGSSSNSLEILWKILPEIIVFAAILFLTEAVKSITKLVRVYQGELVRDYIQDLIHKQSLKLDLSFFESTEYYNKLHRARVDAISRPVALLENLGALLQNSITLIAILALLITYKWWLSLVIVLGSLPVFPILIYNTIRFHTWRKKATILQRKTNYYSFILAERESAAEIRLFDLGGYFQSLFHNLRKKLRDEQISISKQEMMSEIFGIVIALLIMGSVMVWMLIQALAGVFSLGSLTMFYISFDKSQKAMTTLMSNIKEIYKNIVFIENLFEFLDIKPKVIDSNNDNNLNFELSKSIKLNDVSFSYPFSERSALENFTLEIPANKITAIVGTNGAGKSTFIKLLCRFYDPSSGDITIDDNDYKSFSSKTIQKNIAVLFQEHLKFQMTVSENILMGNLSKNLDDIDEVKKVAIESGADRIIKRLPKDYQNMLGRMFSGSELSTGEWQLISIARSFLKGSKLLILDEPTSAMDPWAETKWLQNFKEISKNRTSVIITHRFTTAMQADIIYVMDKGTVLESGSHNELMSFNGVYAESWNKQNKQINEGVS